MTKKIIEIVLFLIAHASAGIYSSPLKYSKRFTFLLWGLWVTLQTVLLFIVEFLLTNAALETFVGFALSLAGQYAIFFLTTKGRLAQRIFTILSLFLPQKLCVSWGM